MNRRKLMFSIGLASFAPTLLGAAAKASDGADLSAYRWRKRLLLVFAPIAQDPRLAAQRLRMMEERAAFESRDLLLIEVGGRSVRAGGRAGTGLDSAELRARYEIEPDMFATLLIGKDGGEKLRREGLMPTRLLFETIDAMPMRRREMRTE